MVLEWFAAAGYSVSTIGTILGSPQQFLPAPHVVTIQLGPERKAQIFCCQHWGVGTYLEADS